MLFDVLLFVGCCRLFGVCCASLLDVRCFCCCLFVVRFFALCLFIRGCCRLLLVDVCLLFVVCSCLFGGY